MKVTGQNTEQSRGILRAFLGDTAGLWNRFWYLRGVFILLPILALVANVFDFTQYDAAKAILALLAGWDEFAGAIGQLFGFIPFVPDIPASTISIFAIVFAGVGAHNASSEEEWFGFQESRIGYQLVSYLNWIMKRSYFLTFLTMTSMAIYWYFDRAFHVSLEELKLYQEAPPALRSDALIQARLSDLAMYTSVFFAIITLLPYSVYSFINGAFRRGVVTCVIALAFLTVLYYAPIAKQPVQAWSDCMLNDQPGCWSLLFGGS